MTQRACKLQDGAARIACTALLARQTVSSPLLDQLFSTLHRLPAATAAVMVSAGFCHLLGESIRQMHLDVRFPLPTFLCGLGFMLTLVADAVASTASGAGHHHHHAHGSDEGLHGSGSGGGGACCGGGGMLAAPAAADPERGLAPGHCKRLHKNSSLEEERLLPNGAGGGQAVAASERALGCRQALPARHSIVLLLTIWSKTALGL